MRGHAGIVPKLGRDLSPFVRWGCPEWQSPAASHRCAVGARLQLLAVKVWRPGPLVLMRRVFLVLQSVFGWLFRRLPLVDVEFQVQPWVWLQ